MQVYKLQTPATKNMSLPKWKRWKFSDLSAEIEKKKKKELNKAKKQCWLGTIWYADDIDMQTASFTKRSDRWGFLRMQVSELQFKNRTGN